MLTTHGVLKFLLVLSGACFIMYSLASCYKTIDDSDEVCYQDCTRIQGRIQSADQEGISGVQLQLSYLSTTSPPLIGSARIISNTTTDESGFYSIDFYVKDEELGYNQNRYFTLDLNASHLNAAEYIQLETVSDNLAISNIERRDTIFSRNYFLPKATHVTVHLKGLDMSNESNTFFVKSMFPYGVMELDSITGQLAPISQHQSLAYYATTGQDEFQVIASANEFNTFKVSSRFNGDYSFRDTTLYVPAENTIELFFDY